MNFPENPALRELLLNTLTKDTAKRWPINQILSSEWMRQNGFAGIPAKQEQNPFDARPPAEKRTRRGRLIRAPVKLDL